MTAAESRSPDLLFFYAYIWDLYLNMRNKKALKGLLRIENL